MPRILISVLIILCTIESFSQKLLFHKNRYREVFYETGEAVSFRLFGDRTRITRQIRGFEDSLIVFQDFKVNPKNISSMYVDKKIKTWFLLRYKYQYLLPAIGGGYLFLEWANTGKVEQSDIVFSASMIGAGIIAKAFIPTRIKIKGRKKLVIINVSPPNRRH